MTVKVAILKILPVDLGLIINVVGNDQRHLLQPYPFHKVPPLFRKSVSV